MTMPQETEPPATILVVDDESAITLLVTRYLSHLGYHAVEATSAAQALATVRRQRPRIDLVLTDAIMPEVSGIELATILLANAPGPSVILMTGALPPEVERLDIAGQIVRVLRKPLDLDELQQVLRVTLEGYPADDEPDTVDRAG
jgi:CheY-like chemotaxis protein